MRPINADSVRDGLDKQMRKVYQTPQPSIYGAKYHYVLGFTKTKSKKVFWGPMNDEDAYRALAELNDGEIFELTTRDQRRAVREVRDILIKRGTEPDEALKKLLHKRDEGGEKSEGIISKLFRGRVRSKQVVVGVDRATNPPKSIMRKRGLD